MPLNELTCKGSSALGSACGRCSRCVNELANVCAKLRLEVAELTGNLAAMTEDRNLWQGDHEGECPHVSTIAELQATVAAQRE